MMLNAQSKPNTGKRLAPQTWERIRIDHEIKGMSFNELEKRYEVHRSNISRRAQKQGWNREQVQQAINAKITAVDGLEKAAQHLRLVIDNTQTPPKNATEYQHQLEQEADTQQRANDLLYSSSMQGLTLLTDLLDSALATKADMKADEYRELMLKILDAHSKAMLNYSRAVFGNKGLPAPCSSATPKTDKSALIERLRKKHAD